MVERLRGRFPQAQKIAAGRFPKLSRIAGCASRTLFAAIGFALKKLPFIALEWAGRLAPS
jgi:hypothetical protein